MRLLHHLQRGRGETHADDQPIERCPLTQGVVRGFQIRHQLKRRHAAINRRRIVGILRDARIRPLGDVAHGGHDVALDQPGREEVVRHHVDVLLAGTRHSRQREQRRLLIRRRALQVDAEETAPPVLEAGPAPAVTVDIVAGAHVGIRGAQMSVEHRHRKTRRAVVHVDVGATAVRRNRDLNRRRATLRAIVGRVALVKDGVVDTALELLRPRQRVQRGGDQADVDAELVIAGRPGDLAADRLHVLDQRERILQPRQLRARRVGERRRHQGVRDGVERRLRGDGENLVVKRARAPASGRSCS